MLELRTQGLSGDLSRDADLAGRGIGGHKAHFIDLDGTIGIVPQGLAHLGGHILRLGSAGGKCLHQAGEIFLGNSLREMDAGQARSVQELGKAALGLTGFERRAIQQQLVIRYS